MRPLLWVVLVLLVPSSVFAQATLTGTVKDNSGAVLPGVTVEASSPALIEKTRTAVTDDTGQYRIVDLRPGTYSVTFTLPGFVTVKRDAIEVAGTQAITIPVEMKVGGLEETITVTGETPVVDVQNARRELVMKEDVIQELPVARAAGALLNVTPGLQVDNNGVALSPTMTFFNAHSSSINSGSVAGEGRMTVNGMTVAAARSGGVSSYVYDTANSEEVNVRVGGGLGESDVGGPVMNLVPKSGGNLFSGTAFFSQAGRWSSSNNLTDELKAQNPNLTQVPGIIQAYDASGSVSGPIMKDHLWFFGSYRALDTQTTMDGIQANANAGDPTRWDWVGSPIAARLVQDRQMIIGRLTSQLGKNRVQFNSEYQHRCEGTPLNVSTNGCHDRGADWIGLGNNQAIPGVQNQMSPEATSTAARGYFDAPYYLNQGFWSLPLSNKLLLDAGYAAFRYNPLFGFPPPDGITNINSVIEQSSAINPATGLPFAPVANYQYRAVPQWGWAVGKTDGWQTTASYVTGAHSLRVGYQGNRLDQLDQTLTNSTLVQYIFNQGTPIGVNYWLPDFGHRTVTNLQGGFVQDSWTHNRLTVQGALRYDHVSSYSPVDGNGTTETSFLNASPITFGVVQGVDAYNDLTPRVGVAYDLFGTGRTALKFNAGKYLAYAANDPPYTSNNPAVTIQSNVTNRGWIDSSNDKVVDCDLTNPAANGECAAAIGNAANFGRPNTATIVDPKVLSGWGVRPHDNQYTFTVQQQVIPRVSADFSFTHRSFHGFLVTNDLNRDPATAYDTYTVTAPQDARLPDGGGYPITIYTVKPSANVPAKTFLTWDTTYGPERKSVWDGFDFTANARLTGGLVTSFGTSTGRALVDTCDQATNYNQVQASGAESGPDPRGCHNVEPWLTQIRGLATYTVPKIDVLVSATIRSQPPILGAASWIVPTASVVVPALGRTPVGALATTTIPLNDNANRIYLGGRLNQLDMRFAKVLRFNRTRADVGIDLNNLFNANYPTAYNTVYSYSVDNALQGGSWAQPTSIYQPRFVRLNFTVNF